MNKKNLQFFQQIFSFAYFLYLFKQISISTLQDTEWKSDPKLNWMKYLRFNHASVFEIGKKS